MKMRCPSNLNFDPVLELCSELDVDCTSSTTTVPSTTYKTTTIVTPATSTSSTATPTIKTTSTSTKTTN